MQRRTICVQSCSRALTSVRPAKPAEFAPPAKFVGLAKFACPAGVVSSAAAPIETATPRDPSRRAAGAVAVSRTLACPKVRRTAGAVMPQLNVPTYCMVLDTQTASPRFPRRQRTERQDAVALAERIDLWNPELLEP